MQKETITSRQNPLVKAVCGLSDKKKRVQSGLFRFDGIKLFSEALAAGIAIKYVIYSQGSRAADEVLSRAEQLGQTDAEIIEVLPTVFEKMSDESSPEGVICVAFSNSCPHTSTDADGIGSIVGEIERILIAESVRDPGNVGTVIRTCFALGIDRLILSDDCADIYSAKAVRASMGGVFRLNITVVPHGSMAACIAALRATGRRIYATALGKNAAAIGTFEMNARDCFVIGNEGHGLSESTVAACDECAVIPMRDGAESLNAAVAAAICAWETVRIK